MLLHNPIFHQLRDFPLSQRLAGAPVVLPRYNLAINQSFINARPSLSAASIDRKK